MENHEQERMLGLIKMREKQKEPSKETVYEKALEDILKAHTVGEMVKIADRVLKENRK